MSRPSLKETHNLSKDKQNLQSRLTQSSSVKAISRASYNNSVGLSSSSSLANISINFMKDSNFPKLFNNSPMLFSFNAQPQTTKSSVRSSSNILSGLSSGMRTPSASSLHSSNHFFERESAKRGSLFSKKSKDLVIDISKKINTEKEKIRSSANSIRKQLRGHTSSTVSNDYQNLLSSYQSTKIENIKIFIRIKPTEVKNLCIMPYIMKIDEKHLRVDGRTLVYDHIFSGDSLQQEVFQKVAKPVVSGLFEGYNGTIFAYGQTGSGKTHTIFGGNSKGSEGLISRSIEYIFSHLQKDSKISMTLLQIYKEQLIDLLNQTKVDLKIKETAVGGVMVEGLLKISLEDAEETLAIIHNAEKLRRVASTRLNQKSSRSHTILTIYVESMNSQAKLCLIDLAGSEKASKSGVNGQNFEEMKKINYSLSCLGNVINALVTRRKSDHIPFRDSKLTRLLKDSLSGRFRTSIIVNCSADPGSQDETISSIKFADRAKKVRITISKNSTKGKQNVQYLHKVILQLTNDLENTKRQLNKYKQICIDKQEEHAEREPTSRKHESPQITARQTIPSERIHLDEQMKKYGKENQNANMLRKANKEKVQKTSINLSQLSSLNVSKSTMNVYGQMNCPSVSSLTYRADENLDDLSFHFSIVNGAEGTQKFN